MLLQSLQATTVELLQSALAIPQAKEDMHMVGLGEDKGLREVCFPLFAKYLLSCILWCLSCFIKGLIIIIISCQRVSPWQIILNVV